MDSLQSSDPASLERCHRWLLFHYHCTDCGQSEDVCEYGKTCVYGKTVFTHVRGCSRSECSFPRCNLIKSILGHHQLCKDADCQVCAPVCKYQARNKALPPPPLAPHGPCVTAALLSPLSATPPVQCSEQQQQQPSPSLLSQPSPQTSKRNSSMAELDIVQGQPQEGPQQQQQTEQQQQHVGLLFEARHREHKRHLSGSHSLWTLDTSSASVSGASSGGCIVSIASAASGSVEAAAELQALQLERSTHQLQQQPHNQQQQDSLPNHQQQQGQLQQRSTATSSQANAVCSMFARQSAPASIQHALSSTSANGRNISGSSNLPPAEELLPVPGYHLTAEMQPPPQSPPPEHQNHYRQAHSFMHPQQLQLHPNKQPLQQQCGVPYAATVFAVPMQPPVAQQQQQPSAAAMPPTLQPPTTPHLQQQQQVSVAQHQAVFGATQFATPTTSQNITHLQQTQPFAAAMVATRGNVALSLPTAGATGVPTAGPLYISVPHDTVMQQTMQMGAPTHGLPYTFAHHHYGAAGQVTGMLLPPSEQHLQPQQQHSSGSVMVSAGQFPSPTGSFVGCQLRTRVVPMLLGCGPVAAQGTGCGPGPGPTTAWNAFGLTGVPRWSAELQQQQSFRPDAASSGTTAPMFQAPQLAGTS